METTTEDVVALLELPAPKPSPGCLVCQALIKQWRQARDPKSPAHDKSHATDLAVEIKRHPHPKRRRSDAVS